MRFKRDKVCRLRAQLAQTGNLKELQLFLGMTGYNRIYVENYSTIAEPLTRLTRKNEPFVWGKEQQDAKDALVAALVSPPILQPYDQSKRVFVTTDASNVGMGAVLKLSLIHI